MPLNTMQLSTLRNPPAPTLSTSNTPALQVLSDQARAQKSGATAAMQRVEELKKTRAARKSKAMNIIAHTLKYVRDGMDLDQAWAKAGGTEPLSSIAKIAGGLASKVQAAREPVFKGLGALDPKSGSVVQGDPEVAKLIVQQLVNAGVWNKPLPTGIVPGGNAGVETSGSSTMWWVVGGVGALGLGWLWLRRKKS